ncbi:MULTISPECIES: class I SAM-dependent methyltransferase [Streptomyces]|uniref:Class I SAM-dependent methyltransferase n=1 Tax=Streptomyces ramulosus TaxID=47762 RepID=A0ABW1FIF4_9ACTN
MSTTQYDGVASRIVEIERALGPYREHEQIPAVLDAVGSLDGVTVLDAGCGTGAYSRLLRRRGAAEVLGVDSSAGMVAAAQALEEREPLGVAYRRADLSAMDVVGAFGVVTAISVLHYADSRETLHRMCGSLFAHLASGGRLVTVVGNADLPSGVVRDALSIQRPTPVHDGDVCTLTIHTTPPVRLAVYRWSRAALEQALRAGGFADVTFAPVGPVAGDAGEEPAALLLCARRPGA